MSFHRHNNALACMASLKKISNHDGDLTSDHINDIYKYRTIEIFVDGLQANQLVKKKIIEATQRNYEVANKLLATRYAYSPELANKKSVKRIVGKAKYIIFNANHIVDILVKHKHQPGFLEKHLHESNHYFSIKTLAREDAQAFSKILATPELLDRLELKDIKQLAKKHIKNGCYCFPKMIQSKKPEFMFDVAKCMAEAGDAAAMLYLANAEFIDKLTYAQRAKYLQASADCDYLPAKAQLAIFNYLGANGSKTNEESTVKALIDCLQEAKANQDVDVKKKIEQFFLMNPKIKKKVEGGIVQVASGKFKQSTHLFSAKAPERVKDPLKLKPKPRSPS